MGYIYIYTRDRPVSGLALRVPAKTYKDASKPKLYSFGQKAAHVRIAQTPEKGIDLLVYPLPPKSGQSQGNGEPSYTGSLLVDPYSVTVTLRDNGGYIVLAYSCYAAITGWGGPPNVSFTALSCQGCRVQLQNIREHVMSAVAQPS